MAGLEVPSRRPSGVSPLGGGVTSHRAASVAEITIRYHAWSLQKPHKCINLAHMYIYQPQAYPQGYTTTLPHVLVLTYCGIITTYYIPPDFYPHPCKKAYIIENNREGGANPQWWGAPPITVGFFIHTHTHTHTHLPFSTSLTASLVLPKTIITTNHFLPTNHKPLLPSHNFLITFHAYYKTKLSSHLIIRTVKPWMSLKV